MGSEQPVNRHERPGRTLEDRHFPPQASREAPEQVDQRTDVRVLFSRQRQPKGEHLERLEARVKPETAAWLRKLAGDSSIGMALDYLRNIFPKQ